MAEPKNRKRDKRSADARIVPVSHALRERQKRRYVYAVFMHRQPIEGDDPLADEISGFREGGTPSASCPVVVRAWLPHKADVMEYLAQMSPGLRARHSYGPVLVDERFHAWFTARGGKDVLEALG